jgi:ATP-dependent DNA helicase RecG
MARKYSRSRRFAPSTERALFKDQQLSGRHIDRTDLIDAIRGGEDSYLEFKSRLTNPEKLAAGICALANSGGGTIVFGVTDQLRLEGVTNPELIEQDLLAICREQLVPPVWARIDKVSFDSGLRLVVFEVDARRAPHRTTEGRYYIRVGATKREATGEEIAELYRGRTGAHGFEDTPLGLAEVECDIDEGDLWGYVRDLGGGHLDMREDYPLASLLHDMRLAARYGEDLVPTVAGILLFGKGTAVAKRVPQSPLLARRVTGMPPDDQVVEQLEFVGDLASVYDRTVQFVERYADLWDARPRKRGASPVAARPFFPRGPVLEALANALVHRDYAQHGPVRLTLYDDRLDLANPAPDAGLTRRSLRLGVREPTNPRLKGIFHGEGYGVRRVAGGVPMILHATRDFTRGETVRFAIGNDTFRVEIPAV